MQTVSKLYDLGLTSEIAKRIRVRLGQNTRVVLFGSRADGTAHDHSDYDIGIELEEKIPSTILMDIRSEMERLPTLHTIDVVDLNAVADNFSDVALEHIIEL